VRDNKEKCKQKRTKSTSNIKLRSDTKTEAINERQKVGEEKWNNLLLQFKNNNPEKADTKGSSSHPWVRYTKTGSVNNIRENAGENLEHDSRFFAVQSI